MREMRSKDSEVTANKEGKQILEIMSTKLQVGQKSHLRR